MNARWLVGILSVGQLFSFATAAVTRADTPECKVSGWVVESASDHLVIESQKERMWFELPKADRGKKPLVQVGEHVMVVYSSRLKSAAQATEVRGEGPEQAPGEVPKTGPTHPPVIDDRAYYPG